MSLKMKVLLVFAFAQVRICAGTIRPSDALSIMDGEGFTAYLELPKAFGPIDSCWFKFEGDIKIKIDLDSFEAILTARGEEVQPFSNHICGVRVNKLSTVSAGIWTLEAENTFGDHEQGDIKLTILSMQKKYLNTSLELAVGNGAISCNLPATATKQCKIVDHNNKDAFWNTCVVYTHIRPNRTFDCYSSNSGRMTQSLERIVVKAKNTSMYTTASISESDGGVVMRCQFNGMLHACQAEMPGREMELQITEGLYNGRYSAHDTSYSKQRCALEIPKPLAKSELGLWRIYNTENTPPTGCLFYIGKSNVEIMAEELIALNQVKKVRIYDTDPSIEQFTCEVPFIIDDCYLRDPNNTVYFPDSIKFERTRTYGECQFSNMPVMAGTWTCGARGHDYAKEVLQVFEVIVKAKAGELLTESLKRKLGKSTELMCQSAFEEPLTHCAFIDPLGRVHLVGTTNSIKTAGHVKYFGRGLLWGDCGAQISETTTDDYGAWKCQFVTYADKRTSIFVLRLRQSVFPASTLGLVVGITIILLLLLGLLIATVFYRRRNRTAEHNFTSTNPLTATSSNSVAMTALANFDETVVERL